MKKANFKRMKKRTSHTLKVKHKFFIIFLHLHHHFSTSSLYLYLFFIYKALCVFKTKKLIKVRQKKKKSLFLVKTAKSSFYLSPKIIILCQMNYFVATFYKTFQCFSFYHIFFKSLLYNNTLLGMKKVLFLYLKK